VGLKRGPLSLVSTTEELLGRNNSGSSLENWEYCCGDPPSWAHDTLYPKQLALTSPTHGGRSVCIFRSRTEATGLLFIIVSHEHLSMWPDQRRLLGLVIMHYFYLSILFWNVKLCIFLPPVLKIKIQSFTPIWINGEKIIYFLMNSTVVWDVTPCRSYSCSNEMCCLFCQSWTAICGINIGWALKKTCIDDIFSPKVCCLLLFALKMEATRSYET
jgi:hypothetical protein